MIETMEEIMHLERVTVGAGALTIESVEDAPVAGLARRMQRCWISTIGYRIFPPPRLQFVVCDNVRYLVPLCKVGPEALHHPIM